MSAYLLANFLVPLLLLPLVIASTLLQLLLQFALGWLPLLSFLSYPPSAQWLRHVLLLVVAWHTLAAAQHL
jgi:hypothetical protein